VNNYNISLHCFKVFWPIGKKLNIMAQASSKILAILGATLSDSLYAYILNASKFVQRSVETKSEAIQGLQLRLSLDCLAVARNDGRSDPGWPVSLPVMNMETAVADGSGRGPMSPDGFRFEGSAIVGVADDLHSLAVRLDDSVHPPDAGHVGTDLKRLVGDGGSSVGGENSSDRDGQFFHGPSPLFLGVQFPAESTRSHKMVNCAAAVQPEMDDSA
jgi:hypothetical protein